VTSSKNRGSLGRSRSTGDCIHDPGACVEGVTAGARRPCKHVCEACLTLVVPPPKCQSLCHSVSRMGCAVSFRSPRTSAQFLSWKTHSRCENQRVEAACALQFQPVTQTGPPRVARHGDHIGGRI
jgi:hypothetical protein